MTNSQKQLLIFLAIDGSDHAQIATEYLCSLPLPKGARIVALAVLDTPHTPRRQLLLAALEHTQGYLKSRGFECDTGLLHGHPAEALSFYADEHKPDLIVMGAKGMRATLGILLGGIAQQVITYAKWPVLITRPPFRQIQRVLIATDGSNTSKQTLRFLSTFPFSQDTEFSLVYVVPPMPDYHAGSFSQTILSGSDALHPIPVELLDEVQNWQMEAEETGKRILKESSDLLQQTKQHVNSVLLHGDSATEIINFSKDKDIDLIIAGSRGLGTVKGWLLGSVSNKLVHFATCSVLIYHM